MRPRVLGVIPARKGSRRLPGKNLMDVGGRSLIARAVDAALDSGVIDCVVVDSDDAAVRAEANRVGADHVLVRPPQLGVDSAPSADVVARVLQVVRERYDFYAEVVVTLQPTSPLRTGQDVEDVFRTWQEDPSSPVASVARPLQPPKDLILLRGGRPWRSYSDANQEQAPQNVVFIDGMVYVTPRRFLEEKGSLFNLKDGRVHLVDPLRAVDVDFGYQLELARRLSECQGP